jgi:hypothetical protein
MRRISWLVVNQLRISRRTLLAAWSKQARKQTTSTLVWKFDVFSGPIDRRVTMTIRLCPAPQLRASEDLPPSLLYLLMVSSVLRGFIYLYLSFPVQLYATSSVDTAPEARENCIFHKPRSRIAHICIKCSILVFMNRWCTKTATSD